MVLLLSLLLHCYIVIIGIIHPGSPCIHIQALDLCNCIIIIILLQFTSVTNIMNRMWHMKRPMAHYLDAAPKRSKIVVQLCDLPAHIHEIILDKLDGTDLFNAITCSKSVSFVSKSGLYASKRLDQKYGSELSFPVAAMRTDPSTSVAPGSVVHELARRYKSNVMAVHPKTGTV